MPPVLNAQNLSKRFGAVPLFENISLAINAGDRIALLGPNGAGKSTLLAVLAGDIEPDSGSVARRRDARIAYVRQISEYAAGITVRTVMLQALTAAGIEDTAIEQRLRETLGRAGFVDGATEGVASMDAEAAALSGGWRKRLAIAEAIATAPDVLLLDEPTNHLDIEGIEWLEGVLRTASFASIVVTHDRYFMEAVAGEVMELSRVYAEGALRVRGNYSRFLERREEYLASQQRNAEGLRNRVRTEVEWLRRGPKARATKAKARIDTAHAMIGELAAVDARMRTASAGIAFDATDRQTKRLIELEDVTLAYGDRVIVRALTASLANGAKLGIVGPNGSGKTTILRALTGDLAPAAGIVKRAPSLRIVYFSQMRELDESLTLRRALAPDSDAVVYQDRAVHVASYAAKFLFTGEQLNQPVARLSGGERARVLLARLMLVPADVLVLDEPTNDLDIPTLEILEDALREFAGALILVTHDRYLLDRVTNSVLGLDGRGTAALFADYAQWEQWKSQPATPAPIAVVEAKPASPTAKKKLSYLDQREWDTIEQKLASADATVDAAKQRVEDPQVATDPAALLAAIAALNDAQAASEAIYARWAELAEKVEAA